MLTLFGVPENVPVAVLKVNPEGNVGANAKVFVPAPPLAAIAVNVATITPCSKVTVLTLGVRTNAGGLITINVNVLLAVALALSVTVIVKTVDCNTTEAVPLIDPVAVLKFRPAGRAGLIAKV